MSLFFSVPDCKSRHRGLIVKPLVKKKKIFELWKTKQKNKSTHGGGRTHNLLIRSQTRCHYATLATVMVMRVFVSNKAGKRTHGTVCVRELVESWLGACTYE